MPRWCTANRFAFVREIALATGCTSAFAPAQSEHILYCSFVNLILFKIKRNGVFAKLVDSGPFHRLQNTFSDDADTNIIIGV
jgi:hypothetical protein